MSGRNDLTVDNDNINGRTLIIVRIMDILRDGSTSDYILFNVLKVCEGFITDLVGFIYNCNL